MGRIDFYKIAKRLGFKVALKAFLYRAFPAEVLYGLFDEIKCPVSIFDATGFLMRSDWISAKSKFLKYRIPNEKITEEAKALLGVLETDQLF
jgi:hypothetical protein